LQTTVVELFAIPSTSRTKTDYTLLIFVDDLTCELRMEDLLHLL